jgi:signal transduction histidine kinase
MNLKFAHQAALLVLIPLIFEIIFLCSFLLLLDKAQHRINRANHAKSVHEATDRIFNEFIQAGGILANYLINKSPVLSQEFDQSSQEIMHQLDILESLLANNPYQLNKAKELRATETRALGLMSLILRPPKDIGQMSTDLPAVIKIRQEIARLAGSASGVSKQILAKETETVGNLTSEEQENKPLKYCIVAGLVMNILLTASLAVYFYVGVQRRLSSLMENTARLAKREPLNPPLVGSDELAVLDRVLQKAGDDLRHAQQMKSQFVSMVSHDLRTPMANMRAFLEALSSGLYGEVSAQGIKKVVFLEGGIDRLNSLISELLDIEKLESASLQPANVSLKKLLEKSVAAVSSLGQGYGVTVELEPLEGDTELWADESRIVQVIVNLLSNALKFSPTGGKVAVGAKSADDNVEIMVKDEGCGIAKELQAEIFQIYKRVPVQGSGQEGFGLGLYIAKTIVEGHRGTIGVKSEEGKGSTFWFRLPLEKPSEQRQLG